VCQRGAAVQCPLPIGAGVEGGREAAQLVFFLVSASKYAAHVSMPAKRKAESIVESSQFQTRRPLFMSRK